jgi:NADH-quinone oxidoreductase subunit L
VPHENENTVIVPALALLALLIGVGLAALLYRNRASDPLHIGLLRNRLYIDNFYQWLIDRTQELLARIANFLDRWMLNTAVVRGAGDTTFGLGRVLRLLQMGNLQGYVFLFGLGIVLLIYFTIFK